MPEIKETQLIEQVRLIIKHYEDNKLIVKGEVNFDDFISKLLDHFQLSNQQIQQIFYLFDFDEDACVDLQEFEFVFAKIHNSMRYNEFKAEFIEKANRFNEFGDCQMSLVEFEDFCDEANILREADLEVKIR